jgi:hypothetical protein
MTNQAKPLQQLLTEMKFLGQDISYGGEGVSLSNPPMMVAWSIDGSTPDIQVSFLGFTMLNSNIEVANTWAANGHEPWGVTGSGVILLTEKAMQYLGLGCGKRVHISPEFAYTFGEYIVQILGREFTIQSNSPATIMMNNHAVIAGETVWEIVFAIATPCSKETWDRGFVLSEAHYVAALEYKKWTGGMGAGSSEDTEVTSAEAVEKAAAMEVPDVNVIPFKRLH